MKLNISTECLKRYLPKNGSLINPSAVSSTSLIGQTVLNSFGRVFRKSQIDLIGGLLKGTIVIPWHRMTEGFKRAVSQKRAKLKVITSDHDSNVFGHNNYCQ